MDLSLLDQFHPLVVPFSVIPSAKLVLSQQKAHHQSFHLKLKGSTLKTGMSFMVDIAVSVILR